jgi:hypothetical protein
MWAEFVRVEENCVLGSCVIGSVLRVKRARTMGWAAQVTRMGDKIKAYRVQDVIRTDCTLIPNSC